MAGYRVLFAGVSEELMYRVSMCRKDRQYSQAKADGQWLDRGCLRLAELTLTLPTSGTQFFARVECYRMLFLCAGEVSLELRVAVQSLHDRRGDQMASHNVARIIHPAHSFSDTSVEGYTSRHPKLARFKAATTASSLLLPG